MDIDLYKQHEGSYISARIWAQIYGVSSSRMTTLLGRSEFAPYREERKDWYQKVRLCPETAEVMQWLLDRGKRKESNSILVPHSLIHRIGDK